jgi:hypothetical protein
MRAIGRQGKKINKINWLEGFRVTRSLPIVARMLPFVAQRAARKLPDCCLQVAGGLP